MAEMLHFGVEPRIVEVCSL